MVKLYLAQHGDALAKEMDPDRPLSGRGHDDVRRMADFLGGSCRPARICHSGKTRARQTAELFAAELLAPGSAVEALSGIGPNDPVTPFAARMAELGEDMLLVGHLPFIAKLATALVTGREAPQLVDYRPGSVLCLASSADGRWAIEWMVRPELVAD